MAGSIEETISTIVAIGFSTFIPSPIIPASISTNGFSEDIFSIIISTTVLASFV